jgi:hypothetical protein
MAKKLRATWVSRRERDIWCLDFSGFAADRAGLIAEIEASDAVIRQQREDSLLVAVDLCKMEMTPEIAEFFRVNASRPRNPIRKMAVLYVTSGRRLWYRLTRRVTWPKQARFFDDYEKAKDWLVGEAS